MNVKELEKRLELLELAYLGLVDVNERMLELLESLLGGKPRERDKTQTVGGPNASPPESVGRPS